ncbi:HigA family addiction module antitoxin [Thalassospira sp.]|uniref:HigA family addiction module antitoxin n=1 Tax=Thalassospira sp. TaxID=1912094 RepID=UPI00273288FC|nr:HigA family addiction module antitoxin [Thalassospira sp.]MDP2697447.1 HigA family addiction module antitoxin [Thalassospira sp.]
MTLKLPTITEQETGVEMTRLLKNPHPGDILNEEFLEPLGLSQNALAQAIGVPANRISEIIRGRRGITADTDLRLCRYFQVSDGYWLHLQNTHDIMEARREVGADIDRIVPRSIPEDICA